MATREIPVRADLKAYRMTVDMDQESFDLTFFYNLRSGHWAVTIEKAGVVLLHRVKLVNTPDLLYQVRHIEALPAGTIIVQDVEGQDQDPDGSNFGDRVVLLYQEAA